MVWRSAQGSARIDKRQDKAMIEFRAACHFLAGARTTVYIVGENTLDSFKSVARDSVIIVL